MPDVVFEMLKTLPSYEKSEWLFPGTGKSGHLADARSGWKRVREKAAVPDVTVNDLRRTVASWVTLEHKSLPIVGRILNHRRAASTEPYARLLLDPVRTALEDHAGAMLEKLGTVETA